MFQIEAFETLCHVCTVSFEFLLVFSVFTLAWLFPYILLVIVYQNCVRGFVLDSFRILLNAVFILLLVHVLSVHSFVSPCTNLKLFCKTRNWGKELPIVGLYLSFLGVEGLYTGSTGAVVISVVGEWRICHCRSDLDV